MGKARNRISCLKQNIPISFQQSQFPAAGIFLHDAAIPSSLIEFITFKTASSSSSNNSLISSSPPLPHRRPWSVPAAGAGDFLSMNFSTSKGIEAIAASLPDKGVVAAAAGDDAVIVRSFRGARRRGGGGAAMNTTKHLWAGAVAAMVSRFLPFFLLVEFYISMQCYAMLIGLNYNKILQLLEIFSSSCHYYYYSYYYLFQNFCCSTRKTQAGIYGSW